MNSFKHIFIFISCEDFLGVVFITYFLCFVSLCNSLLQVFAGILDHVVLLWMCNPTTYMLRFVAKFGEVGLRGGCRKRTSSCDVYLVSCGIVV